ncbi:hypothetical protein ILYODFUR_028583 [Ilyodon furcidens]|uniref:Uncharacterized protein n=1 Tax=Ilyodon furcidens TaxID=33524 RepID=A0ABV0UL46_9TELE
MGCMVAQLVALLPCSKKVLGSTPWSGELSACSLHVLPVHAWVLSGYSGFLLQSKNMTTRLIGLSQQLLGVNGCVHGCLSCRLLMIGSSSPAKIHSRGGVTNIVFQSYLFGLIFNHPIQYTGVGQ